MNTPSSERHNIDRLTVDPRKTYYVLNPSGDLKNTEGRFVDWLKDMASVGWEGVVGRAPSELQLSNALTWRDLVMYEVSFFACGRTTDFGVVISDTAERSSISALISSAIYLDAPRLCSGYVLLEP